MSQIRTVKIFDRLPHEPVLREVVLNWDGRTEPEPASLVHSSRLISIDFWLREDQQPDLYQDVLAEAEDNGLNPGLKKERDAIRALLKAAEQKTSK